MDRAYSILQIKSVDAEQRVIEGIASTPTPDRGGDIMEPAGAKFVLPMAFLWNHKDPIGEVYEATVRPDGIHIKARFAKLAADAPLALKERIETAWHSISSKPPLARGLSIGWSSLKSQAVKGTSYTRFLEWVWGETSAVVVPMNAQATITNIKSFDQAASGLHSPGVTGTLPTISAVKAVRSMTTSEQIISYENTRAARAARMTAIMAKSADAGTTLDQAETDEYDDLASQVKSVDAHLVRLREHEKVMQITATPITTTASPVTASELRGGQYPVVTVKANVPKGTAFTRFIMAKVAGKNSLSDAIQFAEGQKQWMDQTPEVLMMLKAAVNPGTVAEPAWAAPLAVQQPVNDFLELLRPEILIGKITGLREGEFNISMPVQTGGGTYAWVGEGAPKPVGNLQFASVTLGIAKAAGIIVISEELAKVSKPSAEGVVRMDMIKGMRQYLDQQFIDPTVAAVTNVSPASITNLANGFGTAGTSGDNARTDIKKAITLMTAANYPVSELVLVMSEANAFALSTALTSNGVLINSMLTAKGGSILGVPVVTSQSAGSVVALIHAPSILYATGGLNIDVSREASIEMNTAPTSPVTASSAYVSLWQLNLIGLRADWFINWKRARTTAVVYTTATYV